MGDPQEHSSQPDPESSHPQTCPSPISPQIFIAMAALVALCGWVVWRFGGTDLFRTMSLSARQESVVNTFASVDHPFHATRAATLLDNLGDGNLLRWVADHQGGYPVEFYPLGVAWFEVALWGAFLGSLPILAIHKIAILLIFVLPAAGFWIMARGDRLNPWLPVLATALHVSVPGLWTHGGYEELVHWGLVTNVAGAALALIASAALARAIIHGQAWWGAVSAFAIAGAVYTNPRSVLAIAITAVAIAASAVLSRRDDPALSIMPVIRRIALVGAASVLISAPVLVPLLRYRDLYVFVHYESYASPAEYWSSTLTSVSPPVLLIAIVGALLAAVPRRFPVARAASLALVGYVVLTAVLSANDSLIEQLESPRLMPFQRLLMIYLAAFGITQVFESLVRFFRVVRPVATTSAATGVVAVVVLVLMLGPVWTPPENYRTREPDTTADGAFVSAPGAEPESEFLAFQDAVRSADGARREGTAILVIGDRETWWWHEQLWGPSVSDAPFFYDDWLWYWHTDHEGPYNYLQGHFYRDPAEVLRQDYLQAHGIGAVVVTNMNVAAGATDPREAASGASNLERAATIGNWDVYRVADPTTIISSGNVPATSVIIDDQLLRADFAGAAGEIEIRRNWFPRWEAFADGEAVEVLRTDNGYMRIVVPPETATVQLRYGTTAADWLARLAVILGLVLSGFLRFFWNGQPLRRFRVSSASRL